MPKGSKGKGKSKNAGDRAAKGARWGGKRGKDGNLKGGKGGG